MPSALTTLLLVDPVLYALLEFLFCVPEALYLEVAVGSLLLVMVVLNLPLKELLAIALLL